MDSLTFELGFHSLSLVINTPARVAKPLVCLHIVNPGTLTSLCPCWKLVWQSAAIILFIHTHPPFYGYYNVQCLQMSSLMSSWRAREGRLLPSPPWWTLWWPRPSGHDRWVGTTINQLSGFEWKNDHFPSQLVKKLRGQRIYTIHHWKETLFEPIWQNFQIGVSVSFSRNVR